MSEWLNKPLSGKWVAETSGKALIDPILGIELADWHRRVHVFTPVLGSSHTGRSTLKPASIHRGHGRAGRVEELRALHGLHFFNRHSAAQIEAQGSDQIRQQQSGERT